MHLIGNISYTQANIGCTSNYQILTISTVTKSRTDIYQSKKSSPQASLEPNTVSRNEEESISVQERTLLLYPVLTF